MASNNSPEPGGSKVAGMHVMNLQSKARPILSRIEHHWFENSRVAA